MRLKLLLLLSCCPFLVKAQNVKLQVAGTWVNLSEEEMQTEIKPGWTIAGKKLKDTQVVYLWGKSSHQISDDNQPVFRIVPGKNETLVDYSLIRLKVRKDHRRLPKSELRENDYTRIHPESFSIQVDGDSAFICKPLQSFAAGEYILTNIAQTLGKEQAGYRVYPLRLP